MSPPTKQLTVFVTFHVSPANVAAFKAAHRPLWAHVAHEPECLFFDVFHDTSVPGRFRFVEVWARGREWFEEVQMKKAYYRILWEDSKPLWTKDFEIEWFEREGEGSIVRDGYLDLSRKL